MMVSIELSSRHFRQLRGIEVAGECMPAASERHECSCSCLLHQAESTVVGRNAGDLKVLKSQTSYV